MRNLIISACIIGLFLELSGLLWSLKKDNPSDTFISLTEPPARVIEHPLENGYFLLLGMAAASGRNPIQTGYDIWLESDARPTQAGFDFNQTGRSELRLPVAVDHVLPEWYASNPLEALQKKDALYRISADRYRPLVARYEQWLQMPFEDWGYAHQGAPRIEELLGAHRLYVAEGFSQQTASGLARLSRDLAQWRMVLREARTLPIKMMATVMIDDDVQLLSGILSQDSVDRTILTRSLDLLQPLTTAEYSLQWPVQSHFTLTYLRNRTTDLAPLQVPQTDWTSYESIAHSAHLPSGAFQKVEHPQNRQSLTTASQNQQTWNTYAAYYDALIKTADSVHSPLPKLHDIAKNSTRTFFERVAHPLEFEPEWTPFSQRLVETDARLRLVSLQVLMRKPTATATIPTRLAEVGAKYYDPFSGLPMLWSPTQRKLYSVGKDHLDDGGDPSFDISVPLSSAMAPPSHSL
ncbi:MAG: hypothetical protein RI101_07825 [Nitrospira sp.]|nr:hypothetical protein [Nitrospira sp.]